MLDRPEAQADPELFTAALLTAARAARFADIGAALRLGEQAAELARQLGADRLLIESLAALSSFCFLAGEPERQLRLGLEAVQLARQLGDDVLLGQSLQACLMSDAIDPAHARPLFTEATAATQRSGDHLVAATLTGSAAIQALITGTSPPPGATWSKRHKKCGRSGMKPPTCRSTWAGCCARTMTPTARASFQQALRMSRRTGNRAGIAYATLGLACLAADAGDWHRAAVLHGVAQAFLDRTGLAWEALEARYRQGQTRPDTHPPRPRTVRAGLRHRHGPQPRRSPRPGRRIPNGVPCQTAILGDAVLAGTPLLLSTGQPAEPRP